MNNPVDWYPWGSEAFDRAIKEDKPILLSIGYSACHWCHVMEKESFEDPLIAGIMNENFINIKVDREERPDIDKIYMNFVQLTTGSGGWPLTVVLSPQLIPFFGGTYFPPEDRYGRPGFTNLLKIISTAYKEKKSEISSQNKKVVNLLEEMNSLPAGDSEISINDFNNAFLIIKNEYDAEWGGFGDPPKFPCAMTYLFLLRYYVLTKNNEALEIIKNSLIKMSSGGIYDQLGGGFHRYSTDERWLVPHFEKMLYYNALLARLYLEVYLVTKDNYFLETALGILKYVSREMTDPSGGFYASQNADTEEHEGRYYLWKKEEISNFLTNEELNLACKYFNISDSGNFESFNILTKNSDTGLVCRECGISEETLNKKIFLIKEKMLMVREKRAKPSIDDKILSSLNGLMIYSFAYSYGVTGDQEYLKAAVKCANFIWSDCFRDNILYHSYKNGQLKFHGYLDNYSFMIEAFIVLYEVTFEESWLTKAKTLADLMIEKFYDAEKKDFSYSPSENSDIIISVKDQYDNATPAGNSSAVFSLLKLSFLFANEKYLKIAKDYIQSIWQNAIKYPLSFSYILCAGYLSFVNIKELAITVKNPDEINDIKEKLYSNYLPFTIIALKVDGASTNLEFLKDKKLLNEKSTFYICENYICKMPLISIDDTLIEILNIDNYNSIK
jgi:uncharacterized protein YyaL (SSP411 family)